MEVINGIPSLIDKNIYILYNMSIVASKKLYLAKNTSRLFLKLNRYIILQIMI
jgi:hypothetical protein